MIAIGLLFVRMLCDCFKSRPRLEAEILVLRHQLNVLQQHTPRRRLHLRRFEPVSFPAILERQGDFAEVQGGRHASPAKTDWISIIWTGLSLLQEQGGYYSVAGRNQQDHRSIGVMDLVRSRATVTSNSLPAMGELLRLAGVPPSNKKAAEA